MSYGIGTLHSHSGLERELKFPKHIVLVDTKFASLFHQHGFDTTPFVYKGIEYVKAPTLGFVKLGGTFKNLDA